MKFDHFEFHTRRGTLLIGGATDADIAHWQKALGQRRMQEDAVAALRELHDDQASGLRQLAGKLDLLPRPSRMDDRQVRIVLLRAINERRVAAVFLPSRPASMESNAGKASGPRLVNAISRPTTRSVASMSPAQRIETMLGRVPDHLKTVQRLKAAFLALVSPESVAMLALSFAVLAAAQAAGVGEIADAALAGAAYYEAGVPGLWALLDMIKAVTNAAAATTDQEIDRAADLFAGAFIVLGATILAVLLHRAQRGKGGENSISSDERPTTGRSSVRKASGNSAPTALQPFDGEFATRQLLGTSNTPGGRRIMFHAADRMKSPPRGRRPMSPAEVDSVLDGATKVVKRSYHRDGGTLTIENANMPGTPRVIVDEATGNRIITVINPKGR